MNTGNIKWVGRVLHVISLYLIAAMAFISVAYTLLCAAGLAPWLSISATFGETVIANAGQILQIAATVLVTSFAFFLPANARIVALENSHRKFHLKMEDVARAYHYAHSADRDGVFTLSSEFDQVRERLAYLRDHPDLANLETDVMEIAAQMSQQSRHLADTYAVEKVKRAKTFLQQRQQEAEQQQERIVKAQHEAQQLQRWAQQVDVEESVVASQLSQLEERLSEILPELGLSLTPAAHGNHDNVVPLKHLPAAE
ncbi:DNA repair protein [Loktanella agnita]|uniref:DNA repair protein n=1 Tax=Loktanella agnita TaxID=287097 RepID=UPI0039886EF5